MFFKSFRTSFQVQRLLFATSNGISIQNEFSVKHRTLTTSNYHRKLNGTESSADDIKRIAKLFHCTNEDAIQTYEILQLPESKLDDIIKKVNWLKLQKATVPVILGSCEVLLKPFGMNSTLIISMFL